MFPMAMPITLILVDLGAVILSWPRRLSTAMLGSSAFRAGANPPRYFEEAIGREKSKRRI